jgi:outer membrane PBP1 activator LpoA protein
MKIMLRLRFLSLMILLAGILTACTTTPFSGFSSGPTSTSANVEKPTKIALLVPIEGSLGATGQAIRNSFLSAYFYAKEQQENPPTVTVVDTSGGNITALYQQAVAQGANFIVGPLTKMDVQTLASSGQLSVPTLALNTLDNNAGAANLYQFGLSPQDEAAQVAEKAFRDGHRRALVISPIGAWGQGIADAFTKRWQSLGGTIVDTYAYPAKGEYTSGIRDLLQVTQRKSDSSGSKAVPEHRQDADVIFLAAFPQQARQIRPLLLFYNAGDLPVYATSLIYSGVPSPMYDQDLNGIIFADMPWVLNYSQSPRLTSIHQRVTSLWPSSFNRSPRLYGFGVDAYTLATQFNDLNSGIAGATGQLSLGQNGVINRELSWAQIRNGVPVLLK